MSDRLARIPDDLPPRQRIGQALELCSTGPTPDYTHFKEWLGSQLRADYERARSAVVECNEDWNPRARSIFSLITEYRPLTTTAEEWTPECLRRFQYFKLLSSSIETFYRDGVHQAVLERLAAPTSVAPADERDLNSAQLRARFFTAVEGRQQRRAFKLLGALRRDDHADGELEFLESFAHLADGQLEEAIVWAGRVPTHAPDAPKAAAVLLEAHARSGRVAEVVDQIQELPLTPGQTARSILQLLLACTDPRGALNELSPGLACSVEPEDPAYATAIEALCPALLELCVRYRAAEHSWELYGEQGRVPTATEERLELAAALDPRMDRLLLVAAAAGLAGELLQALSEGRELFLLVNLALSATRRRPSLHAFVYHAFFRLGDYQSYVANFHRAKEKLRVLPEFPALAVLCYQSMMAVGSPDAPRFREELEALDLFTEELEQAAQEHARVRRLSPMAAECYRTALRSIEHALAEDFAWCDAGLVALAFFRVIEAELCERLVAPLLERVSRRELAESLLHLPPRHKRKWEFVVGSLQDARGFDSPRIQLKAIFMLLCRVRKGPAEEDHAIHTLLSEPLSALLTDSGRAALASKKFEKTIDDGPRERFRNPPAHARFVHLSTARAAKAYVDEVLDQLHNWFA